MVLSLVARSAGNKKPTTVASRGFLSKSTLASTSPGRVVQPYSDEQQFNLSNDNIHEAGNLI
jgi:hypothetical protein